MTDAERSLLWPCRTCGAGPGECAGRLVACCRGCDHDLDRRPPLLVSAVRTGVCEDCGDEDKPLYEDTPGGERELVCFGCLVRLDPDEAVRVHSAEVARAREDAFREARAVRVPRHGTCAGAHRRPDQDTGQVVDDPARPEPATATGGDAEHDVSGYCRSCRGPHQCGACGSTSSAGDAGCTWCRADVGAPDPEGHGTPT